MTSDVSKSPIVEHVLLNLDSLLGLNMLDTACPLEKVQPFGFDKPAYCAGWQTCQQRETSTSLCIFGGSQRACSIFP